MMEIAVTIHDARDVTNAEHHREELGTSVPTDP
jgi:hypothetical protein